MQFSRLFGASCKDSSAYNNQPSGLGHTGSTLTTAIASIAATGLILSSAGFGAVYAYTVGIQHGPLLATLTVLFAVALELIKPIAVRGAFDSFRSWRTAAQGLALLLLGVVAVAYSLTAELALTASSRGDLVAKREAATDAATRAKEKHDRAKADLSAIKAARPAQELEALVAAAAPVCRVMVSNGVRTTSCNKPPALVAELGRAKRKAELEATMMAAETTLAGRHAVKTADPGPTAIATYLASVGIVVSVPVLGQWLNLIAVLGLELGSALSAVLVQAVSGAAGPDVRLGQHAPEDSIKPDTASHASRATPEKPVVNAGDGIGASVLASCAIHKRTPARGRRRTRGSGKAAGKRRLGHVIDLLKARGGQISGGQRGIAKTLGLSKSRANEVLHELAAAGALRLSTSRSGTRVQIIAAA